MQAPGDASAQLGATTAALRSVLAESLAEVRESLHADVRDVHVELVRQAQLMQVRRGRCTARGPLRECVRARGSVRATLELTRVGKPPVCMRRCASTRR